MELVSIGRSIIDVNLFDTKGGKVKLYSSLTVDQEAQILQKHGTNVDKTDKQIAISYDKVCAAFIEWNIGADNQPLPCTQETLKSFTMRDFFVMLQACTGQKLIDENGNAYSPEESAKKGKSV